MPTLANHQSNDYTKLLLEGDSGSGKTGSLASLVAAGYNLRILDYDNGLETLKAFISHEFPDLLDRVEFRTLRDKRKATAEGAILDGAPKAFVEGIKLLDRWRYKDLDGRECDLGVPAEWGPEAILVLDSLTLFSDAAFNFCLSMVSGKYDIRAVYKNAQDAVENTVANLTSEGFRSNVIVISHVKYIERPDGSTKGYPTSVGSALSPQIPMYFNSVALCQTNAKGERTIQTAATAMIDLKNPKPFAVLPKYPISTGLADFFEVLREKPKQPVKSFKKEYPPFKRIK